MTPYIEIMDLFDNDDASVRAPDGCFKCYLSSSKVQLKVGRIVLVKTLKRRNSLSFIVKHENAW